MLQITLLFKPVLRGESPVANYFTVQTGVTKVSRVANCVAVQPVL